MPSSVENADVLDAMADQIRSVLDDVTDVQVQVEPRMVISPTPPAVDMWPGDVSRDRESAAFDDDGGWFFTIRARVSTADQDAGQDLLLALMDDVNPLSVGSALMDDQTLNGTATSVDVTNQTGYVLVPDAGGEGALLGCLWTVLVLKAYS